MQKCSKQQELQSKNFISGSARMAVVRICYAGDSRATRSTSFATTKNPKANKQTKTKSTTTPQVRAAEATAAATEVPHTPLQPSTNDRQRKTLFRPEQHEYIGFASVYLLRTRMQQPMSLMISTMIANTTLILCQ